MFSYKASGAATDVDTLRLLLNDVDEPTCVFQDEELQLFLDLENGVVKLAAAQAIDTNADNELLASKVLRTQDVQTDGAKLADSLRKRATELRRQYREFLDDSDDGFFDIIDAGPVCGPELAGF